MPVNLTTQPQVKVGGAALSNAAMFDLRSVRVELSLWVPGRCTLRLEDPDFTHVDGSTFAVGATLEVGIPPAGQASFTTVFKGEITDVALEPSSTRQHELVVGALDKSHRLGVANKIKTYANQTLTQIAQTVAGDSKLSADIEGGLPQVPYLLQASSDYAFLWDLALRTNCEWWVADGTLHFKKRGSSDGPELTWGDNLSEFRVRYSGANKIKKVTVRGWDSAKQEAISSADSGGPQASSFPDIGGTSTLATDGRTKSDSGWADEVTATGYAVADTTEAKAVADALGARVAAAEVLARGATSLNPMVKIGQTVNVKSMGTKVSGKYLVTTVEHIITPERTETRFTAGNKAPVQLADLVGGAGVGPASSPLGNAAVVTGVVTAITGDPDGAGRIKVKFPWLSDEDETAWARMAAPGAGDQRGFQWMPEINDEVVIGFENGDSRFPIVLGNLWSKKNAQPVAPADPNISRMIKSKAGHTLEISDGDGDDKKHIALTLADGQNKFRLGADKTNLEVASGKELTIKAGSATIKVDSSGNVSIEGGKISIKAQQDLELNGLNVKINAQANVEISANAQFKASGNAGANLETSAIAVVKGTMVKIN